MPYTQFDTGSPVASQTKQQVIDKTRENLMALRDAVIIGMAAGWSLSVFDGPAAGVTFTSVLTTESATLPTIGSTASTAPANYAQPTLLYHRTTALNSAGERFMMRMGWNANGYPDKIRYYYTSNYVTTIPSFIGRETITYDASNNVTGITWDTTDS